MNDTNIKFKKVEITNFRNINELTINFNETLTEIKAENGKGKTNILSAILWCLFGKNIYDEKAFVISPIIDGVEKNEICTNVKITFTNGYVISRSNHNRKTTLQTGYELNGEDSLVNITQRDFENELKDKLIDLETFKSLSNINYLPNLNWKDLKELILNLIGDIKDEEVLLLGDFSLIEEQIRVMGINSTKDALNASNKSLNEDLTRKESEYQTLINTKDKYVLDDEENKELEKRRDEILNELDNINEKINEEETILNAKRHEEIKLDELNRKKVELVAKKHSNETLISSYLEQYNLFATDTEILRQQEINGYESKKNNLGNRYKELVDKNVQLTEENEKTKILGEELKAKEIKVENDTCSSCGQILPEEKINSTLENLRRERDEELTRLRDIYQNTKIVIEANNNELLEIGVQIKELDNLIEDAKGKVYENGENDKQKQIRVQKEQLEIANCTLSKELEQIEKAIIVQKEVTEKILCNGTVFDTKPLTTELNEINEKLATTITLNKINDDIKVVEKELEEIRNNKVIIKDKLEQVAKFNNAKSDLLREKAKSNFKIVDFKTREFTQDGVEQETFKICIDGVDYKELNTGFKILVAIDLVSGIQKLKGLSVPILIDNAESVTKDIEIENTQIIVARATKGIKELEIK